MNLLCLFIMNIQHSIDSSGGVVEIGFPLAGVGGFQILKVLIINKLQNYNLPTPSKNEVSADCYFGKR